MSDEDIRPYPSDLPMGHGAPPHLTDYWYVLTRRVWLVVGTLVLSVGGALWAMSRTPTYHQARVTLQVNDPLARSKSLTSGTSVTSSGIYVDPIQSEIQLLASRAVAARVVDALGLRLTSGEDDYPRSALFSDGWVGDDAVDGTYVLAYVGQEGAELQTADGQVLAGGRVGQPLAGTDFGLTPAPMPGSETRYGLRVSTEDEAVAEVLGSLVAVPRESTNLIDVYYASLDPAIAAPVANAAAEALKAIGAERVRSGAAQDVAFIDRQLDSARTQLTRSLADIRDFKETRAFTSLSFQEQNLVNEAVALAANIERHERHLDVFETLTDQMARSGSEGVDLVRFLAELPSDANPEIKSSASRIQEQVDELDRLLRADQKTRSHPEARAITEQIGALEANLNASVRASIAVTRAELASAVRQLAAVRERQRDFPGLENQLQTLELQQSLDQTTYQFLLSQLYQARITESAAGAYLTIVDPATGSTPVSGRRPGYLVLSAVLGLILGIGGCLFLEYLDRTVRTSSEVEGLLGLPVLGVVPTLRRRSAGPRVTQADDDHGVPRLAARDPFDSAAESFRNLRLNLTFVRADEHPLRSILVTSPGPDEGKSTTSLNLAITLAQQGERVVLVDADLRRPTLHQALDVEREPGLTNLLIRDADTNEVIHQSVLPNLDVIPSGVFPPNPAELVSSMVMRRTLRVLEEKYDRVIVDSPPTLAVTDAAGTAAHVDGVLMVLRSGKTEQRAAERATEQLRRLGLRILGVALNDVPPSSHEESYYLRYQARYLPGSQGRGREKRSRLRAALAKVRLL